MPSFAFAAQSTPTDTAQSTLAGSVDMGSVESFDEPAADAFVQVSADLTSAKIDDASFALDEFSRAQKGSSRPIDGVDYGYTYLVGTSPADVALIATSAFAVVYVDEDIYAQLDSAHKSMLKAYLLALDEASASGTGTVSEDECTWVITTEPVCVIDNVSYRFNQQYQSGYYYASVKGPDGADITTDSQLSAHAPLHADFASIKASEDVAVVAQATGMSALKTFFEELDWSPLWVTLKTTGTAIVIVFILGLLVAWWSLRIPSRAQDIADSILTIPMVLPPTVCGFILLLLLGKNTLVGQWFIDIGFPLIFSWPATVLAAVVVSFPLMYRSARGAFESIDPNMLDAARTLGWSETRIFYKLMMPLAWSSIAAGTVLAFARALGEFGATLFLAGNYVGITRTIPIAIYFEWMNGNTDIALFWTAIIIVVSFLVILFINLWGRHTTSYRKKGDIHA